MIKEILFDKDGTLIDFYEVWGTAAEKVAERFCECWKIPERQQQFLRILGIRNGTADPEGALAWKSYAGIAEELLASLWEEEEQKPDSRKLEQELSRLFYEETALKRTEYPTFTEIKPMMEWLKQKGIRIGLSTTDNFPSTKKCMQVLEAEEYLSFWGVSGAGLPEKPDGALIRMAAEHWAIRPDEIAVVGDTPNDMRFAHNGGALAVAVRSGTGTAEVLEPLADYILSSVAELTVFIEENHQKEAQDGAH